jgi:LPS export ABC transporter protein LptC
VIYRIFAFLTVVAVIIGSLLLSRQEGAPQTTTVAQSDANEGYSARDAQLWETGANGRPLYTVDAALIRELPRHDTVRLTRVSLSFLDPSGNKWLATADRGEIVRGSGQVQLAGHVHVTAAVQKGRAPILIRTAALTFDSHTDRVSTADPVTLLWAGQQLDAKGLIVSLKTHRLQLESQIHAIVTPSH